MSFKHYLKDKTFALTLFSLVTMLIIFIIYVFTKSLYLMAYVGFLLILAFTITLAHDYIRRKNFYNDLLNVLKEIDNKALIHEMLINPTFIDGKIILDVLYETNKYKIEEIAKAKIHQKNLQEFIEMWVHEIKTPLASASLIMENNPSNINHEVQKELLKLNDYVEQILFYARSENVEKDYLIKKVSLETVINKVILRYKQDFILKKINLELSNLDVLVYTDTKWLEFIIGQIISNSLKYVEENPKIKIYAKTNKEEVTLYLEDNGIGIERSDLPRIFDKGFTGQNGRKSYNSTGIGLYLVKQLCDKLGHNIVIYNNHGTTVKLIFPIGSYTKLNNTK